MRMLEIGDSIDDALGLTASYEQHIWALIALSPTSLQSGGDRVTVQNVFVSCLLFLKCFVFIQLHIITKKKS